MGSKIPFKRISVVGLGYIGLPTAAMFASRKIEVIGVDVEQQIVDTINRGQVHIVEPELESVVRVAVQEGYLRATTNPEPAEAFLIAVPTPLKGENNEPDLGFVKDASLAVAQVLERGNLVILESTSPVGTTELMADWMSEARPDLSFPQSGEGGADIRIAHCPERVLPGKVMRELITNDRIIGGMTPECSARASSLYKIFVTGDCVLASGPRVAEMAKLTENSFRDVNIAFANELSLICDELSLSVWELVSLANRHPRVNILQPGPGVGGHCVAVDPWFIVNAAPKTAHLVRAAREVNISKPGWTVDKVKAEIDAVLAENPSQTRADITIAIYGLAFKADIDDLRESPALEIARELALSQPGKVLCVEPHIAALPENVRKHLHLVTYDMAVESADIHLALVDHSAFRDLTPPAGRVIDTKGFWTD